MTNRFVTIRQTKIIIIILLFFILFSGFNSYGNPFSINSITGIIFIPEKSGLITSTAQTENISRIDKLETEFDKYIPGFIRDLFNSYTREKYDYRTILLFFLIISLFIFNIIFVILIFIYSNRKQNDLEKYLAVFQKMYEGALLSYILGETDWEETHKKLKKSNLPQNRELLSSILMNFNENLKGVAEQMIPDVFIKLGLQNDALKQANSKVYYEKVSGIRKLTLLFPEGAMKIIPGLLNDDNDMVRSEAQTSYVRLNPADPFHFLKTLKKPFTRWTQINAFHLFRAYRQSLPTFAGYLDSNNPNVRSFSLRMIIFFQQLENIPEVLKMINSEDEQIRFLSIKAINDLRLYDGKLLLKERFENETPKNKIEIIKAFKNIGSSEDFQFLENIIAQDKVSLKLEACRSLFYMSAEGNENLKSMNEKLNGDLNIFISHISDSRNG
jgi:hypothetical protein